MTTRAVEQPSGQSCQSARRWFPLRSDMMQQEAFVKLSPCEKVVLLDINYRLEEHLSLVKCGRKHGPFGESDATWAKRLVMSVEAFRCARRKFGNLEWVIFTPGYRTRDGEMRRTEYRDAKYAEAVRGILSGALYRDVWHDLIAAMQKKQLHHRDLVVAIAVSYFWKILGGREMGSVTIAKVKLESMSGMPATTFKASLERLRKVKLSSEHGTTSHFDFRDKHRSGLQITKWAGGPDSGHAGFSDPISTPDSVPLTAILTSDTEAVSGKPGISDGRNRISASGGNRESFLETVSGLDRWASGTRVAANSEGGWGSHE